MRGKIYIDVKKRAEEVNRKKINGQFLKSDISGKQNGNVKGQMGKFDEVQNDKVSQKEDYLLPQKDKRQVFVRMGKVKATRKNKKQCIIDLMKADEE